MTRLNDNLALALQAHRKAAKEVKEGHISQSDHEHVMIIARFSPIIIQWINWIFCGHRGQLTMGVNNQLLRM